jgi:hypothetical protein
MRTIRSHKQGHAGHVQEIASSLSAAGGAARGSRAGLLAGASLFALALFVVPGAAFASCTGTNQNFSGPTLGPVFSNGGAINVLGGGRISGVPTGVNALSCSISALTNTGSIGGFAATNPVVPGGVAVSNSQTITTLTNGGTINGGHGGPDGAGGTGIDNVQFTGAAINTLTNNGTINGGAGGVFGPGGFGVFNGRLGVVSALDNNATIRGGAGGFGGGALTGPGFGGGGVVNVGTITTLTNNGFILGGAGGGASSMQASSGNYGLGNAGAITTLANAGTIRGGAGGHATQAFGFGGSGGDGVVNSETFTTLTSSGTIAGGQGGSAGSGGGRGGDGLRNSGLAMIGSVNIQAGGKFSGGGAETAGTQRVDPAGKAFLTKTRSALSPTTE